LEESPGHINNFGIEGRVIIAKSLTAKLVVLPVSAGLRSVVSENRSQIIELYRLGKIMHTMLHVSPAH
jgi:hypothetical protein